MRWGWSLAVKPNCLKGRVVCGNALKRSPGIIRKSRVSYPGPGFLSSPTWPSLPKKHYNGLNQTKPYIYWDNLAGTLKMADVSFFSAAENFLWIRF